MSERTVFQSMTHRHVVRVGPESSVYEAACVMASAGCDSVLVMEPPDALLGIVTEHDLVRRVLARALEPARTRVREVMTAKPICVQPQLPVSEAVVIMLERGFRHLPVVSGARIMGVFSASDALPREVGAAMGLAEFNEQVNDAGGG